MNLTTNPSIDVKKSIESKWLKCKDYRFSISDLFIFLLHFGGLSLALLSLYTRANWKNENDSIIATFVLPPLIAFLLYSSYRKLFEYRLISIKSDFKRAENKKALESYLSSMSYAINNKAVDYIIASTEDGKKLVILIEDYSVHFVAFGNFGSFYPGRIRKPSLFTHITIKNQLKKLLNKRISC